MSRSMPQRLRKVLGVALGSALVAGSVAAALTLPTGSPSAAAAAAQTREAFVVQLARAIGLPQDVGAAQAYVDVPATDPNFGYVMAASRAGWISGFPGGLFRPYGTLTREQMAKVEILALGLQVQAAAIAAQRPPYADAGSIGRWAWGYINLASRLDILRGFPNGKFQPGSTFTTQQASDAISQLEAYTAQHPLPAVAGVKASGTSGASVYVTITGRNFTGATAVRFGSQAATWFQVVSATGITATVPPGSGTVDVTVATPNGTSPLTAMDRFTYALVPASVVAMSSGPAVIWPGGATTVAFTVKDRSGNPVPDAAIGFGVTGTLIRGGLEAQSATTNSGGVVTAIYQAPANSAGESGAIVASVLSQPAVSGTSSHLTVVNSGVQLKGYSTASTSGGASAVAGGNGGTAGTTAAASGGSGSVTVETFSGNPGPVGSYFPASGNYFDVSLSSPNTFGSVTIRACGVTSGLLYWLDGTAWTQTSATSYSGGCVTFTAWSTSSPSLSQLTGTLFAATSGAPPIASIYKAPGTIQGTTQIVVNPNYAGDALYEQTTWAAVAAPATGTPPPSGAFAFVSGTDLTVSAGQYVNVYEIRSGQVVAFTELAITAADIAASAPQIAYAYPRAGGASGTTQIILSPRYTGDTFLAQVVMTPTPTPSVGTLPPAGAWGYVSGSNLQILAGEYVDIYEIQSGKVSAFTELRIVAGEIAGPAPAIAVASAGPGTALGMTEITLQPNIAGDTFAVQTSSGAATTPWAGTAPPSGAWAYSSGANLPITAGAYVNVYELRSGQVSAFSALQITAAQISGQAPPVAHTLIGPGTVQGTTSVTAQPNIAGDTFAVQVVPSGTSQAPVVGAPPPSSAGAYASGANLLVSAGQYINLYELTQGKIAAFSSLGPLTAGEILGALSASQSSLQGPTSPVPAGSAATYTLKLRDVNGSAVRGQSPGAFSVTESGAKAAADVQFSAVSESSASQGTYTFTAIDDTAEAFQVSVGIQGIEVAAAAAETVTAGPVSASSAVALTSQATVYAGVDDITIQVQPVDRYGNMLTGLGPGDFTVTSSDPAAGNLSPVAGDLSYGSGTYTLTLTDTDDNGGSPQTLAVAVDGIQLTPSQPLQVTVQANPAVINRDASTVTPASQTVTSALTLYVKVLDAYGNAIPGLSPPDFLVTSSDTGAGSGGNISPGTGDVGYDSSTGTYTLSLTDSDPNGGTAQTITVTVDGVELSSQVQVTVNGLPDGANSTVGIMAATVTSGQGDIVLTALIKDQYGNVMPNLTAGDFTVTSSDAAAGNGGDISPTAGDVAYSSAQGYTLTLTDTDSNSGDPQTLTISVDGVEIGTVQVTVSTP